MDVLFQIDVTETFTEALEDILDNLFDLDHIVFNKTIDASSTKSAKENIKNIIFDSKLNTNEVSELLLSKHYKEDRIRIFVSLLEKKKSELLNLTLVHYNCTFGETLNAFDWKLKLVCGTSALKTLSYPLLQIALYTINRNHKPVRRLHELNKDLLMRLIALLEEHLRDDVINDND